MFVKVVKNYENIVDLRVPDNSTIALARRCGKYSLEICGDDENDFSSTMILGKKLDFIVELIYDGKVTRMFETFFSFIDSEENRINMNGYLEDVPSII